MTGSASLSVRHDFQVEKGTKTWLEFTWSGRMIHLDCEVRSSRIPRGEERYRSGLTVRGGASAEEYRKKIEAEMERPAASPAGSPAARRQGS